MMLARPSVAQERWLALAARHPELRSAVRDDTTPWRCATPLTRLLSFVLGVAAAGFARAVVDLINLPLQDLLCGLALLATAEWLIARHHLHASGIEEALWAGGALLVIEQVIDGFAHLGDAPSFLVLAATSALAGWRLANPLFTTIAALLASLAVMSLSGFSIRRAELASLACFAGAFIALGAGAIRFRRPSTDRMLDWLVVVLPVAAYFWSLWSAERPPTSALLHEGRWVVLWVAAMLAAYATAALITGMRRRSHAALIAALLCLPLLAFELRALINLGAAWQPVLWGLAGLAVAICVERVYRVPRAGITSRSIGASGQAQDLLQAAGAAIATPAMGAATGSTTMQGQGGEFGGGGATGRF